MIACSSDVSLQSYFSVPFSTTREPPSNFDIGPRTSSIQQTAGTCSISFSRPSYSHQSGRISASYISAGTKCKPQTKINVNLKARTRTCLLFAPYRLKKVLNAPGDKSHTLLLLAFSFYCMCLSRACLPVGKYC